MIGRSSQSASAREPKLCRRSSLGQGRRGGGYKDRRADSGARCGVAFPGGDVRDRLVQWWWHGRYEEVELCGLMMVRNMLWSVLR